MNIWFTGCTHFNHTKIIEYCQRPFSSSKEMDEKIVENWNKVVKKEDEVYHLGDFMFTNDPREMIRRITSLNGRIHLIRGNHDKLVFRAKDYFLDINDIANIVIENQSIVLCHWPILCWNKKHHGSWHLFSHMHGTINDKPNGKSFDVGIDSHDFTPISFEQVKEKMNRIS